MTLIAKNVVKKLGPMDDIILRQIDLEIEDGEFVALTGKSGSGKSTLLYVLSTLDPPSSGDVFMSGENISLMSERDLHHFRNRNIGFVFQFHYLLPELTALENILMPATKFGISKEQDAYAKELIHLVGLEDKMNGLPRQLSGGQNQRVAIARSLMMKPKFLFADEPTGSLDSENSQKVFALFKRINKEMNTTVVMVTHDPDLAKSSNRTIVLKDGTIALDSKNKNL